MEQLIHIEMLVDTKCTVERSKSFSWFSSRR